MKWTCCECKAWGAASDHLSALLDASTHRRKTEHAVRVQRLEAGAVAVHLAWTAATCPEHTSTATAH